MRKQAHISFARTRIILARAIFDEIHGVRSNFLHGLPVELRTVGYIGVCQTLSSRGKGSGYARLGLEPVGVCRDGTNWPQNEALVQEK